MGISISEFKSSLLDVARPNRFLFQTAYIPGGAVGVWNEAKSYLCQGSSIPGRDIGDITINWQGMQFKIAGDPTFNDIEFRFINDQDFSARNFFEAWLHDIADLSNQRNGYDYYKDDVTIVQLGNKADSELAKYKLMGAYVKAISPIELNMGTENTIEEFTVTIRFDWFERVTADSPIPTNQGI